MSARTHFASTRRLLGVLLAGLTAASLGACTGKGQSAPEGSPRLEADDDRLAPLTRAAASHGFGDEIAWQPLEDALQTAKDRHQPVMLVVHASWCNRCKELKPKFERDDELKELSEQFVMVNADQDLERKTLEFAPDGDYIPRVMFIDPQSGKVDETLLNERRSRNRYFYTPRDNLVGVMKEAIERYGKT